MDQLLLEQEKVIRLGFFFGIFTLLALWELAAPRRVLVVPKIRRWIANLGLVVLNTILLRLLFPTAAVGFALSGEEIGWGLLNNSGLNPWLAVVLGVVALDFAIYIQHVLFHAIPGFWRLHRMHHADLDYDITTGARFHPMEIVLSMGIKLAVVMVMGVPAVAVLIFEVLLNATAMFNHGNIRIPEDIDRILRLFVVTPDMHRVHHSIHAPLTNSNFGFNLPWWDRLMGTYVAQPPDGHIKMEIGLDGFRDPKLVNTIPGMLRLPFIRYLGEYSINRRW
uniref:Sterol desaturase/sphingolipid hydroxylase, fatty acid hydroxylase superfamily n=1 Tax=Candidatus Kentrum sp. TUN TaxID=2126343 RepID=A0A450ZGI6_9GAMM|nr:MAG: Sterol desaturase/sphingolipid hydroxylase, fatty acid hydroxylase superfamily [Candidatus Kentron sp. TUN]VFK52904.1 MAG: Sterol desaturase/sphingolipid hydroxylase, fatty acid hydroxylase superfamily [Candidatus Kentron sp. TUN]VFK63777.1 MAG: Sterol desaturase/sphingolipid hydroxylase, fatty acid hydroxylase superfamily [Candidatus Kentron sp. TUN]